MMISLLLCALAGAPTTRPNPSMIGESLVLAGTEPGKLIGTKLDPASVIVRSAYRAGGTVYERNKDYVLDPRAGTIARTPASRIPDFSTNVLHGKQDFDHSKFPGYGNLPFTVYVDYAAADLPALFQQPADPARRLSKTRAKLEAGGPFKVIAFGDSITFGGDASAEDLRFTNRYAAHLQERFPKAKVTLENGATGGDNTVNGLARLQEKVLARRADLVLVGFGMNDHNRGGVAPAPFQANLETIIKTIREKTGADVILFSSFPPNPQWAFGTGRMNDYAAATKGAAEAMGVPYADVYTPWMKLLERKDPPSLLGNNINHPNDFGHWLYFEALRAIGL
ncbi:MAG: SGNH/GDSL hydrolase family protein [Tepidisphaeraceae bacterium]